MEDSRITIADARSTVASSPYLSADFKATADFALREILRKVNDGTLPVDKANELTASVVNAVLIQVSHNAFTGTGHFAYAGQ